MSKRTRKNNQKKFAQKIATNLARLKIRELWNDAQGLSVAEFAHNNKGSLLSSKTMMLEFLRDMVHNRLPLDVVPLVPGEENPAVTWLQGETLEDALTAFSESCIRMRFITGAWPLPDAEPWNEIRELCRSLREKPELKNIQRLSQLFEELESRVEEHGDLEYQDEEKLVSWPIRGKNRISTKFNPLSALIPHSDGAIVMLFNWLDFGTLILSSDDFVEMRDFRMALPTTTDRITVHQIPEGCLLLMPPDIYHAGARPTVPSFCSKAASRGFMKPGKRISDNQQAFLDDMIAELGFKFGESAEHSPTLEQTLV